jgi:threonylcarbamoyladenosine tRNA methylthiotransferase MtaB
MKRVAFKTVGCRLNQAETAQMAAAFEADGYAVVAFGEPCEVCVVHTCAVTHKAEISSVRLARSARRRGAGVVVLAGCAVEIGGEGLRRRANADLTAGQASKWRLPALLARPSRRRAAPDEAPAGVPLTAPAESRLPRFAGTRALVKVQDGCDFGCAYCVVPAARGRPRSRPLQAVVRESAGLAAAGYREIVLTGANLGCYADGARRLTDLLAAVEGIGGIERIRLSSIELSTAERGVIDFMAGSAKLCPDLHIPLQSGDDGILRAMGRRYTVGEYCRLIEYAVARVPFLGLGTDILAGFPGEDAAAHANTVRVVRDLPFGNLHVFSYSRRPGTRAGGLPDQVPELAKKERVAELIGLGRKKRADFARRLVGRPVTVLVEGVGGGASRWAAGWTRERVAARIATQCAVGAIVRTTPSRCRAGVLYGHEEEIT